jgi:hypothetical protein
MFLFIKVAAWRKGFSHRMRPPPAGPEGMVSVRLLLRCISLGKEYNQHFVDVTSRRLSALLLYPCSSLLLLRRGLHPENLQLMHFLKALRRRFHLEITGMMHAHRFIPESWHELMIFGA